LASVVLSASVFVTGVAHAEGEQPEGSVRSLLPDGTHCKIESVVASTYVVRGRPQYASRNQGASETTAGCAFDAGPGNISFTAFDATALSSHTKAPGSELDLTPQYTLKAVPEVDIATGYTARLFPQPLHGEPMDGGHEFFASMTGNYRVRPMVGIFADPIRKQGAYVTMGVSHKVVYHSLAVTGAFTAGFASYRGMKFGSYDLSPSVTARYTIVGPLYATARGSFSFLVGRANVMPEGDGSLAGRSVPWGFAGIGLD
jgi:hypothetical protein